MPTLKKSCCGSVCIVDGSDKCCKHGIHVQVCGYDRTARRAMTRFRCPCCLEREPQSKWVWQRTEVTNQNHRLHYFSKEDRGEKRFVAFPRRPPIAPVISKPICAHQCRNDWNRSLCCSCEVKAEMESKPPGWVPRNLSLCDYCIPRHKDVLKTFVLPCTRRSYGHGRLPRLPRSRRPKKQQKISKFPTLNCPLGDALEDLFSAPFLEEEDKPMTPTVLQSVYSPQMECPEAAGSGVVYAPSDLDEWPELRCPQDLSLENQHASEESESLVFVLGDVLPQQEGSWEVLSPAGSVWSMESPQLVAGRSYREVLLDGEPKASKFEQQPALQKVATSPTKPKASPPIVDNDEEGDCWADIRDGYKNGQGGKTKKLYRRECKGRRGRHWRWGEYTHLTWDGYASLEARTKESRALKRACRSLAGIQQN